MIRRAPAVALLVVSLLGASRAGDDKAATRRIEGPGQLARAFLDAFHAGDEREMVFLAKKTEVQGCLDPYLVAYELLQMHSDAALAEPPRADDALAAALDLARRVAARPCDVGLAAVVEGWRGLVPDELRRETRVMRTSVEVQDAIRRGESAACAADSERLKAVAADAATDVGKAGLLWQIGDAQCRAGKFRQELATWRESEAATERAPWPHGHATAIWCQGAALYRLGEVREARELWRKQVDLLDAMDERAEEAESLLSIADANESLGEYGEALRVSERAVDLAQAGHDVYAATRALTEAAGFHALLGDAARALPMLENARRRFLGECSSVAGGAWALAVIGRTYAGLGLFDRSVAAYEQSIAEMETLHGYAHDRARYCGELGRVYAEIGRLDKASELQERAWRDLDAAGLRIDADDALARLGELQSRRGEHDLAVKSISRALADMEAIGNRGAAARARADLGRAYAAAGDDACALRTAESALAEMDRLGDRIGASRVLRDLAGVQRRLGRPDESMALARRAVETPLALGIGLGEEEAAGLRRDARAAADEGILSARDLLARPSSDAARVAADAYWFAESSRGLLLADGIVNREALVGAAVAPELREADSAARDRVAALRNRLAALASSAGASAESISAARTDLDAAYRTLEDSTARVQREARRVADVVYPRSVPLADLQSSLGADAAMVLYHLAPGRALAVVVTRDAARLADLGDTAAISARVQDYVDLVSVAGSDETRKAAALYEALLRPLEKETAGRKRIVVSPDGPLALLPFEALVRSDGGRAERAIERWEFAYAPSATVSVVLRDGGPRAGATGKGIVALGDPAPFDETASSGVALRRFGRMRRLPGAGEEVLAIGALVGPDARTLLLRETATGAELVRALSRAPGRLAAVHLACHGRVDTERPRLTGLVLAGGEILSVDDVYRMRVPADLVVLSACDTGRGKILLGEGAINLARGFLFAGASRVVVSNWAVSDDATRALMVAFYTRMLVGGMAPGDALRASKLEMLRAGGASAHPAHWAAFVLWGG